MEETLKARLLKKRKLKETFAASIDPLRDFSSSEINSNHEGNIKVNEDIDPLDAFMKENIVEKVKEEIDLAKDKIEREKEMFENGKIRINGTSNVREEKDEYDELADSNKRCFTCKKFGHTKVECPEKRCNYCHEKFHVKVDCPKWKAELQRQDDESKKRRMEKFKEEKKRRRKEDRMEELREQTGVYGFQRLYRTLGLPEEKLATEAELKKAYQRMVLLWHPDKHATKSSDEIEHAREKFEKAKDAYDMLLEGLEKGNIAGRVVVSKGTLADLDASLQSFMKSGA